MKDRLNVTAGGRSPAIINIKATVSVVKTARSHSTAPPDGFVRLL